MDNLFNNSLGLDPLSPLPSRDPRWFVPAHAAESCWAGEPSRRQTGESTGERAGRALDDELAPMERRKERRTWHV